MEEFLSKVRFTLCDISRIRNILQAPEFFFSCLCADVWIRNKNASVELGLVTFWKILNPECQVILGIRMNVLRFISSLNGACQR